VREEIFAIAEDKAGALWMATSKHIVRVDRDKLLLQAVASSDIREYGLGDGLLSTQGVRRHKSIAVGPSGGIWFSTNRGLSFVSLTSMKFDSAPPLVHVDGISVDGRLIHLGEQIRVRPPHQKITLSYSGLSLSFPTRVRFMYRLDGFDQILDRADISPEATLTRTWNQVSIGFQVMASNSDGVWNSTEAILPFEVEPVLWQNMVVPRVVRGRFSGIALGALSTPAPSGGAPVQHSAGRARQRAHTHRAGLARYPAAKFHGLLLRFQAATNLLRSVRPKPGKHSRALSIKRSSDH